MLNFLKSNKKYILFDIGSHKIAGISFKLYNGKPYITGLDHQKSRGIRNNKLNDIEKLSLIIGKILKNIEKDYKRASFFCNITDPNLTTTKKKTDLNAGKLGISKKEVRKIFRKNLNESEKTGKYLIHSNPNNFILDDKSLTSNPVGKKCSRFSIISFFIDEIGTR